MRFLPIKVLVVLVLLALCGFRFSLLFGELSWEKIDTVLGEDFPDVKIMEIGELSNRLASGEKLYLVDVRSREEYLVSHIPGAVIAEEFAVNSRVPGVVIVTYCSVGLRSAEYVRILQNEGVENVYNLRGSIFMWANSGLALESAEGTVDEVHTFSPRWGKLLDKNLHSR